MKKSAEDGIQQPKLSHLSDKKISKLSEKDRINDTKKVLKGKVDIMDKQAYAMANIKYFDHQLGWMETMERNGVNKKNMRKDVNKAMLNSINCKLQLLEEYIDMT